MFFLIGGIRPRTRVLREEGLPCPLCGHTPVLRQRTDPYLHLFFIPLLRLKKGTPFSFCPRCRGIITGDHRHPEKKPGPRLCPACDRPVLDDFTFCPSCGKPL